jgi:DHA1 family tetracycline resistance protein-like MFS transporter
MARKASLFIIFLTVFIDLLGFGMVLPLLPIYAKQFGHQFSKDELGIIIGVLMASFSVMQFLFAPAWGRLSDRIGRRPVLLVGLLGSTIFYALFGVATMQESLVLLFVARIGAGIAGATISTAQAYIADVTTLETRGKGMALIGAAFGLGFTFGPLLGAAAVFLSHDVATSPAPGYVAASLSGFAFLLAVFKLPESLTTDRVMEKRAWFDVASLRDALSIPSVGALLLTSFVSVVSFGSFEQTISLLLSSEDGHFHYELNSILLVFAYIGCVLTFAQGVLVRRLMNRLGEQLMATSGAIVTMLGFILLIVAGNQGGLALLLIATAVEVTGFAFMTPSLNSLISRRSDPAKQGGILGVLQSISALARIVGPLISIPLFQKSATLPYLVAIGLMVVALVLLFTAVRGGKDYAGETPAK